MKEAGQLQKPPPSAPAGNLGDWPAAPCLSCRPGSRPGCKRSASKGGGATIAFISCIVAVFSILAPTFLMAQAPPSVLQLSCPLRLQGAPNLPARRGRFKSTQTRHAGAGPQGRASRDMHSRKSHTLSGCTNDPFRGIPTCPCTLPQANPNPARHPLIPAPQGSPRPTPTRPHPFATPGPPTGPAGRKRTQHPPQKNLQPPAAPRPLLYKKFAGCSCLRMPVPQIPESQDRVALAISNASL